MSEVTVISAPAPCTFDDVRRRAVPLLRKAGAKRAVVFGSWARGQADGYSDLDLAVVMDTDLPRPQRALALAKELDQALPVMVDLVVYTPEEFAAGEADPFGVFDLLRQEGYRDPAGAPMTGGAQARRWLDAAVDDLRHARYAEEGGFYAHA